MSDVVIKVENLSKQYRLGTVGTGTLSHDLNRFWAKVRGKEDPYLKIGQANDRTKKAESDYVWALKDINFEVRRGEVLGIIGRNGAGKSTLLKILSQITRPTTGSVKMKGRVGSLLEVGTGFHPELTGRENIYINGAILGMRKWEIDKKLDEIIDFAGVERYIDTPVKRYSSGMMVRLGFSVAAHLEPEILIVDEVLAVGDDEFQKKCMGKMDEVSKNQGRTILFVSHNLGAVKKLAKNGLFIECGQVKKLGGMSEVLDEYMAKRSLNSFLHVNEDPTKQAQITSVVWNQNQHELEVTCRFNYELKAAISISLYHELWGTILTTRDIDIDIDRYRKSKGVYKYRLTLPMRSLQQGVFSIVVSIAELGVQRFDYVARAIDIEVVDEKPENEISTRAGILKYQIDWNLMP